MTIPTLVASSFLEDLALVLCVAAFTTLIFQTLRQPVVVGYLIAGMIVGPYTPGLLVDASRIHGVSEMGVILLMFGLGLEFSIRRLLRLGPRAGFITTVQVGLMLWLGYICGRALGWSELEGVFTGALLSISSTTIVAKAFAEQQVGAELRASARRAAMRGPGCSDYPGGTDAACRRRLCESRRAGMDAVASRHLSACDGWRRYLADSAAGAPRGQDRL